METTTPCADSTRALDTEERGIGLTGRSIVSRLIVVAAACLGAACTTMGPDPKASRTEADVMNIPAVTRLSGASVRDPQVHEVHEVKLSCWQMVKQCYPNMPFHLKALGSVPVGCTTIIQQPWNEKVAIVYSC